MKTLADIYENYKTPDGAGDKGTLHSYIEIYEEIFRPHRLSAARVLEIGVYLEGLSLHMWRDYFMNATIYGLDIIPACKLAEQDREKIFICDATNSTAVNKALNDEKFDVIIDDGSHRISDQINSFQILWPRVTRGGIYVIEDIANLNQDVEKLYGLHPNIEILDRRHIKGRYDDVAAVIRKEIK